MSADRRCRIVYLEKTCLSHPAQWSGDLADGQSVYIRYRFGTFSIGIGSTLNQAVENAVYDPAYRRYTDDPWGAELETEALPVVLPEWLELDLAVP